MAVAPGLLNHRLDAANIGLGLGDIAHLDQDSSDHTAGAELEPFGSLLAGHFAKQPLIHLERLLGIAGSDVLLGGELNHLSHPLDGDGAAAGFDGLAGIGEAIGEPAELASRPAAIEIELCKIPARFLAGRLGIGLGLQPLDGLEVGFFAVQDRRDIGDGSWRRDETGGQSAGGRRFRCCCHHFRCSFGRNGDDGIAAIRGGGAASGGVHRGMDAGADRRRGFGTTGLEISGAAGRPHAGSNDRRADGRPAVFPGRIEAERMRCRRACHKDHRRNDAF